MSVDDPDATPPLPGVPGYSPSTWFLRKGDEPPPGMLEVRAAERAAVNVLESVGIRDGRDLEILLAILQNSPIERNRLRAAEVLASNRLRAAELLSTRDPATLNIVHHVIPYHSLRRGVVIDEAGDHPLPSGAAPSAPALTQGEAAPATATSSMDGATGAPVASDSLSIPLPVSPSSPSLPPPVKEVL